MRRPSHHRVSCWAASRVAGCNRIAGFGIAIAFVVAALCCNLFGQRPASQVDPKFVRKTVESLATVVQREYFDPDVAASVNTTLRDRLAQGRYADVPTLKSLADMLTALNCAPAFIFLMAQL